jgi:hypothetical protein
MRSIKTANVIARKLLIAKPVLKWGSRVVNILAIIALLMWVFKIPLVIKEVSYELEPVYVLLAVIAIALNQMHRWLLLDAEYSPAYALAAGYVNNFLSPVITQLKEEGVVKPIICIYKPKNFSELFPNNVDKIKAEISNKKFKLKKVNLVLKHGRARDVLTIKQSKDRKLYFDLPNTLLSLVEYVNYKVDSQSNSFTEKAKEKLTANLISTFYERVEKLIEESNISDNIQYCDAKLEFKF